MSTSERQTREKLPLPQTVTSRQLSHLLDLSAPRLTQLTQLGILVRTGRNQFAFQESVQRYIHRLRIGAANLGYAPDDIDDD